jgi:hypothetical protein
MTRQGVVAISVGVIAGLIGRVFGVIELFIIGVAFVAAPIVAVAVTRVRHPRIRAVRWIHPTMLAVGDVGHVDVRIVHDGSVRSSAFELTDRVLDATTADAFGTVTIPVEPMRARSARTARFTLGTSTRGRLEVGPLSVVTRDPLGLATRSTIVAGTEEVLVVPKPHLLAMPTLGQGALGRELIDRARRLGPGEFHALRDYADGDEPRTIHWKASARSENLKVREYEVEGLRKCTVVFDTAPGAYGSPSSFERAVVITASVVHSAVHAGLTTRMVTTARIDLRGVDLPGVGLPGVDLRGIDLRGVDLRGVDLRGVDLRGPDVGAATLRFLALVEAPAPVGGSDRRRSGSAAPGRDPSEGLGLLVLVTGDGRRSQSVLANLLDPASVAVTVAVDAPGRGPLDVGARTEREFLDTWRRFTGRTRERAVDQPVVMVS